MKRYEEIQRDTKGYKGIRSWMKHALRQRGASAAASRVASGWGPAGPRVMRPGWARDPISARAPVSVTADGDAEPCELACELECELECGLACGLCPSAGIASDTPPETFSEVASEIALPVPAAVTASSFDVASEGISRAISRVLSGARIVSRMKFVTSSGSCAAF